MPKRLTPENRSVNFHPYIKRLPKELQNDLKIIINDRNYCEERGIKRNANSVVGYILNLAVQEYFSNNSLTDYSTKKSNDETFNMMKEYYSFTNPKNFNDEIIDDITIKSIPLIENIESYSVMTKTDIYNESEVYAGGKSQKEIRRLEKLLDDMIIERANEKEIEKIYSEILQLERKTYINRNYKKSEFVNMFNKFGEYD